MYEKKKKESKIDLLSNERIKRTPETTADDVDDWSKILVEELIIQIEKKKKM